MNFASGFGAGSKARPEGSPALENESPEPSEFENGEELPLDGLLAHWGST